MQQEIRFCTAPDGVRIAYATVGRGPVIVKAANWLNHLDFDWESPVWRHVFAALSRDHTLLRYDERGNGLSDWDVGNLDFDAMVQDLETVVDAAGVERFTLLGISQGFSVSLAYAVRHPQRVERLISLGGYARGHYVRGSREAAEMRRKMIELIPFGWGQKNPAFRQLWTSLFIPGGTPEQADWFNELQRVCTSPENAIELLDTFARIDVRDLLPKISVPTLVLHARGDAVVPFEEGRLLAAGIPGARLVALDSDNHLMLEHEPAWTVCLREVREFLGVARESAPPERPSGSAPDPSAPTAASAADGSEPAAGGSAAGADGSAADPGGSAADASVPAGGGQSGPWAPGDRLGRYELLAPLGSGGMAEVYRAHDSNLRREVALKLLPEDYASHPEKLARLQREARLLAALNHPNIATIYDLEQVRETHVLVMELVEGQTLAQRLEADGALPTDRALDIAAQIATALRAAHRAGIVHRDLKPGNVMIDDTGRVRLLDFGIAAPVDDALLPDDASETSTSKFTRLTATGTLVGTIPYMSPEQVRGQRPDQRSDIWALGCVLYEMLTGVQPFLLETGVDTLSAILGHEPDLGRLASTPPGIPELVAGCLEKDAEKRDVDLDAVIATIDEARRSKGRRWRWSFGDSHAGRS